MRSFLKIVLAVAIVLFLLAVFKSFTSSSDQSGPTTYSSSSSGQPSQPAFSVSSGDTTYYGAISSDVGVAILRVSTSPYIPSFGELERADGEFVIVTVAVQNRQNTAITMDTHLFEILDANGNVYSASERVWRLSPIAIYS